jgi:GCC2 and GCC3.
MGPYHFSVLFLVVTERCPAGKYFDDEAGLCRSCGHGFYQPNEGSFSCLLCGLGKTTRTTEAVSLEVNTRVLIAQLV